jgi:hypothetical protein
MYRERIMNILQKALLTLAIIGLVIGIPVTFRHAEPAPGWTLALPVGVVSFGLFLISLLWQKEIAKFDDDERSGTDLSGRGLSSGSDTSLEECSPVPEATASHSG